MAVLSLDRCARAATSPSSVRCTDDIAFELAQDIRWGPSWVAFRPVCINLFFLLTTFTFTPCLSKKSMILCKSLVDRPRRESLLLTRRSPSRRNCWSFVSSGRSLLVPKIFSPKDDHPEYHKSLCIDLTIKVLGQCGYVSITKYHYIYHPFCPICFLVRFMYQNGLVLISRQAGIWLSLIYRFYTGSRKFFSSEIITIRWLSWLVRY